MSAGFGASGLMLPLIIWLVDACGWRTALIALGLGMWIIGIPLALIIRDSPQQYGYLPDGASSDCPAIRDDSRATGSSITIWDVLKDRSLLCLNLAETVRFMALSSVVIHIMPHLSNVGTPRSTAGVIVAAIPLMSIIGRFALGWLGDVFDKRYILHSRQ